MKATRFCLMLTLLLAVVSSIQASGESVAILSLKYASRFASYPGNSEDGFVLILLYIDFDQEVAPSVRAAVLTEILNSHGERDAMKDQVVLGYLSRKLGRDLPWNDDLKKAVYLKAKSPVAGVRASFFYFLSKFDPSDHQAIEQFLADPDDQVRARAVDIIADWPDGAKLVANYYAAKKSDPSSEKSIERAKARLRISSAK